MVKIQLHQWFLTYASRHEADGPDTLITIFQTPPFVFPPQNNINFNTSYVISQ